MADEHAKVEARQTPGLEAAVAWVLVVGVCVAAVVGLVGGAMFLSRHGGEATAFDKYVGEPVSLTQPRRIVAGAMAGDSRAVMQLAILILLATPIMRVVMSLVVFLVQKDRLYVAVTMIVLAVLAVGLWGGVA